MSCAEHRSYLAAMADGETDLVPPSVLMHVRACRRCQGEVETHRLLTRRLREAAAVPGGTRSRTPVASSHASRRRWAAAAAALVVVAALAGLLALHGSSSPDQVLAAASAAQGPPQFRSADEHAISTWCERESGRPMPVVALGQLTPTGARFDRLDGATVVTIDYTTDARARVTVSWLDSRAAGPASGRIEARSGSGRTVLLVRSGSGGAVVAGDAPAAVLWSTAAQLQVASDA